MRITDFGVVLGWSRAHVIDSPSVDQVLHAGVPRVAVDRALLERLLHDQPPPEMVLPLLSSPAVEAARAAILYLGAVGSMRECPVLALYLQHDDAGLAELAEYSLWSIWMQAGTARSNRRLSEAIGDIKHGQYRLAATRLAELVGQEPSFAEAHFQRGLALALLERFDEAASAYREALRLNPYHFAAAAAWGHASVEEGQLGAALHHYRQALRVHPRLPALPGAVRALEAVVEPWKKVAS